jgi:peptidoglycan/LPS O-acetylase OafA/YrhL
MSSKPLLTNQTDFPIKLPELDFIRGISFAGVAAVHLWLLEILPRIFQNKSCLGPWSNFIHLCGVEQFVIVSPSNLSNVIFNFFNLIFGIGYQGVHAFFLVNGFGLTMSLLNKSKQKVNWSNWFYKRFTRIYPTYWFIAIIYILVQLLFVAPVSVGIFVRSFTTLDGLPATWFMFILLQLYLIFPILYSWLNRLNPAKFLTLTLLIKVIVTIISLYFSLKLSGSINALCPLNIGITRSFEFCLGMAAAKWFVIDSDKFKSVIDSWQFITVAVIAEIVGTSLAASSYRINLFDLDIPLGLSISDALIGIGFTGILYSFGRLIVRSQVLSKSSQFLAKYSYEAYLIHIFSISVVLQIFSFVNLPSLFQFSPLVVIIVVFAFLVLTVMLSLLAGFLANILVQLFSKLISNKFNSQKT